MKFGEQGDTIILRITAKNRIKIRSIARDMDLCLLKKKCIYLYNFAFCILTSYRGGVLLEPASSTLACFNGSLMRPPPSHGACVSMFIMAQLASS